MAYSPEVTRLTAVTANTTFVVPAGFVISYIVVYNTTANAVTGGIRIGTTNGGAEVLAALAVGASALYRIFDAAILLKVFSMSADTTLYLQAVVAWNSASLNVYVGLKPLLQ